MATPEKLFASLHDATGAAPAGVPRVEITVNRTTLAGGVATGSVLIAPLAWPSPATGRRWKVPTEVRLFTEPTGGELLARAPIPAAELPPSRPLPRPGEPFTLPGGVLILS